MTKNLWFIKLVLKLSGMVRPVTISSLLSILSLTIGVATLLVAMALVDSYEKTFKESIYSVFSHGVIYPNTKEGVDLQQLKEDISKVYPQDFFISPSSKKEGLLAHKGKVSGVLLDGVDIETIFQVMDLEKKVIQGSAEIQSEEATSTPQVLVGKALAEKFELKVGDSFSVVIPQVSLSGQSGFSRKVSTFRLGGVVDLGSHDYNKRFIFLENKYVNEASDRNPDYFSEVRLKLDRADDVTDFKKQFLKKNAEKYWFQSWLDKSGSLLEAVKIERVVIFFIVLILVVVAAFNVSTNLYLNLAKRLKEFSILQTIGLTKQDIFIFMILNGLLLASVGLLLGGLLSFFVVQLLNFILLGGWFVPPEVYKLTSITIDLSFSKFIVVGFSTFLLCFVASLAPAFNVFNLSIIKGLRYE